MRATTEWLAGARGWTAVAVLAAALAGALAAATLIPGSPGGTATGSASLPPDRTASSPDARTGTRPTGGEPAAVLENITPGGQSRCHYYAYTDGPIIPDRRCAPGALTAIAVTDPQATICQAGYLRRVHEAVVAVTESEAGRLYVAYGATRALSGYRVDHLVAVADGGSATSPANLWLEPASQAAAKRRVEAQLHKRICAGEMTVAQAAMVLEGNSEDKVAR
jgi:hypothetical protein